MKDDQKPTDGKLSSEPVDRKHFDTERLGSGFEPEQMTTPTSKDGYTTMAMPDSPNTGGMPPLPAGRNWNATRPKATSAQKS